MEDSRTYEDKTASCRELFRQIATGDEQAIADLYRRYQARLFAYGIQVLNGSWEEEIKDVIQEFFLWLAQNFHKAAQIEEPEAYLFLSIRRNLLARLGNHTEKKDSQERFIQRTESLQKQTEVSPEEILIHDEEHNDRQVMLQRELDKLPAYQKEVIYLRYYEGLSYKEISNIMAVNDQVARNYAQRALQRLKQQLGNLKIFLLLLLLLLAQLL